MSNISWMYKNKISNVVSMTETYGTVNGDYGTANLADNNIQSYYASQGPDGLTKVLFDFGSSVTVDSFIVLHNTDGSIGGTVYFGVGDTNPPVTTYVGVPVVNITGTSAKFLTSPITYRYFQLHAIAGTRFTKINEVFIGKRDVFSINPEYPFKKELTMNNIITQSEKGKKFVYNKYDRLKWGFKYPAIDDTLYGTLSNMRDFCGGSYKPFFMCIDKDDNLLETFFVRFINNSWKHTEISYGVHDIEFSIEEEK